MVALLFGSFKSCQVPTGHSVHTVNPASTVNVPSAQVEQVVSEVAATLVENLPGGHKSQLVELIEGL